MEVSSHALAQERTRGLEWDVAVFTNLTQDHLDFHGTMENYFESKTKLFTGLAEQTTKKKPVAVINIDDRYGEKLVSRLEKGVPVITYGMGSRADFRVSSYRMEFGGTSYQLDARGKVYLVRVPLIGRFNVANSVAALAAANVARPGQMLIVSDDRTRKFLAPLPMTLLPLDRERYEDLEELGVRTIGQLAGLPGGAVAERLGPDGRRAWGLARGGKSSRVRGRRPPAEIVEALEFPEAIGNELTLRRALGALVETALARPERRDRFVRKVALGARLVGGGSWRRTLTLREPSTEADRIRIALAPRLAELPAPVLELRLELVELTEATGRQLELLAAGAEDRSRLSEGLRQVRASTGSGSVCTVVEVAPWSRIPETRALFVPRDD
jgi:hypothetical protein